MLNDRSSVNFLPITGELYTQHIFLQSIDENEFMTVSLSILRARPNMNNV